MKKIPNRYLPLFCFAVGGVVLAGNGFTPFGIGWAAVCFSCGLDISIQLAAETFCRALEDKKVNTEKTP